MQQASHCECPERLVDMACYGIHICQDGKRIAPEDFYAKPPTDAYDRFIVAFLREMKRMALEPMFSMGELVAILAWLAYRPPWWLSVPIALAWIIWRNRDSGSRAEHRDTK